MADQKQEEDFLLSLMLSCFLLVQPLLCGSSREGVAERSSEQSPIFDLDNDSENILSCFSGQVTNPYCPAFCALQTGHNTLACSNSPQRSTLAAAFEKSSSRDEDEHVRVCPQAREGAWKEHSRSEWGSFCFWQKV